MNAVAPVEKIGPTEADGIRNLTAGLLLLPVVVAGVFLNALTILLLWNWFVVPLGLKPVGYWHALGLSLFVSFIRGADKEYPKDAQGWKRHCKGGYATLVFFGISGWLVHLLMQHFAHQ